MQDIFGSVRRSLVFRTAPPENEDSPSSPSPLPLPLPIVDKINSCIRKSRVFSKLSSPPPPPTPPPIRWRKGELIGCGAFGRVYMGMNLDSGELLAVKQVLIAANGASKEKAQAHIRELEEEVKLLKNLSHPNIVRYLGTVREEETLNILLEFVPGGSISSLLGKFGSFPEAVIRTYTKQLLLGLEYLHRNGIMHRDIKGANILVDNKGCIKLADFGASKQVVELSTIEVGNKIACGAIVKAIVCVHFLNTEWTNSGVRLIYFMRRMGEVEGVLVTYSFHSAWVMKSTSSMNPETAWETHIWHTLVFFATNVTSERD
uniref:mitogen-activated protein kinase kinase kinase n=1 Tax=Fagus sylvatica TaxID=28930 RepID=A0A2N9EVI6_FAGSY